MTDLNWGGFDSLWNSERISRVLSTPPQLIRRFNRIANTLLQNRRNPHRKVIISKISKSEDLFSKCEWFIEQNCWGSDVTVRILNIQG